MEKHGWARHLISFVFVFNLIVGTGTFTIPKSFAFAGVFLGTIGLIIIGFFSYVTACFMTETLYLLKIEKLGNVFSFKDLNLNSNDKIEMGKMASLLYGSIGVTIFYSVLFLYLIGDLSIYSIAIANTLTDISCHQKNNITSCFNKPELVPYMYHIYLITFIVLALPFCLSNIEKTKYLQLFTIIMRWAAIILLFGLSIAKIVQNSKGPLKTYRESLLETKNFTFWNFSYLPSLFGVAIYSFMCHHSIPSLVTVMKTTQYTNRHQHKKLKRLLSCLKNCYHRIRPVSIDRDNLQEPLLTQTDSPNNLHFNDQQTKLFTPFTLFTIVYSVILVFYIILCQLAYFAFPNPNDIKDLYTLNFIDNNDNNSVNSTQHMHYYKNNISYNKNVNVKNVFGFFLAIFPVFPLATNFPILTITLRNNITNALSHLYSSSTTYEAIGNDNDNANSSIMPTPQTRHTIIWKQFALVVIILTVPSCIAWWFPHKLNQIVMLTGAFPGLAIQSLFPALLVMSARKRTQNITTILKNPFINNDNNIKSDHSEDDMFNAEEDINEQKKLLQTFFKHIPFQSNAYVFLTLAWSAVCVCLMTVHIFN